MGSWYLSMHFHGNDTGAVARASSKVARAARSKMLVAPLKGAWINVYPKVEEWSPDAAREIATAAKVEHAVALSLQDSDVLSYWYFRDGKLADRYNSCPDYYGEAESGDMEATGNPAAFDGLLDAAARKRLGELIAARMINGESVGGEPPAFEDARLGQLAEILGISGVTGTYEYLKDGEAIEGIGSAAGMTEVG